jgi:hypothetical protein
VVQLLVAGHNRGRAEQVGLEHAPIPVQIEKHNKQCHPVVTFHLDYHHTTR